jgi:hypothetical protein
MAIGISRRGGEMSTQITPLKIEITGITKIGGPLTKRILLTDDGTPKSDGSACVMTTGTASRIAIPGIKKLADVIGNLRSDQAITLGALRPNLPDKVDVVTKSKLNGGGTNVIARTSNDIVFQRGQPAFALLDFDTKGMPQEVDQAIKRAGGFWGVLLKVLPELQNVAHVSRRSTSAGLFRIDTGDKLRGSDGEHIYIAVKDGADIERFLKTLHDRCWLAGLGWLMVGVGGQLLDRSIVDRMVGTPERLVFEGAPVLDPPLAQDQESRRPIAVEGDELDTVTLCPPLTIMEKARVAELTAVVAQGLTSEAVKARNAFIDRQTKRMIERNPGMAPRDAAKAVERQIAGTLLPTIELPFDDDVYAGCTVADVIRTPDRFDGATLADPIEGIEYGTGKAKIMRRVDGSLWINSFAHGRTTYELKLDAAAVRASIDAAVEADAASVFLDLAINADLNQIETQTLIDYAANRSKGSKRAIAATLKAAQEEQENQRKAEARQRQLAQRSDSRPRIDAPLFDDAWLPVMQVLNEAHADDGPRPPMRDIDQTTAEVIKVDVPNTHAFESANSEDN